MFPVNEKDTLKLYNLVTSTLINKAPSFWLDYFKSLMERDIILPENQVIEQENVTSQKPNYIALKLLHYGSDDNYIIRPGQKIDATDDFKEYPLLKKVYICIKGLKDLLEVPAKSYFVKQVVLLPQYKTKAEELAKQGQPELNEMIYEVLSHPDLKRLFGEEGDMSYQKRSRKRKLENEEEYDDNEKKKFRIDYGLVKKRMDKKQLKSNYCIPVKRCKL